MARSTMQAASGLRDGQSADGGDLRGERGESFCAPGGEGDSGSLRHEHPGGGADAGAGAGNHGYLA